MRSASTTLAPFLRKTEATELFPEPAPPVSPITKGGDKRLDLTFGTPRLSLSRYIEERQIGESA